MSSRRTSLFIMNVFQKIFCKKPIRCEVPVINIMQVDINFAYAKVYDMHRAEIVLGQKFSLFANFEGEKKWFADNDKVLALGADGNKAEVEATGVGTSVILIMTPQLRVLKKITIIVVDAIAEPAKELGVTADAPVPKESL